MKDKRIRCCENVLCEHNQNRAKHKYSVNERYCTACGSELALACSKCFGPLVDAGLGHKVCRDCEAKAADKKAKAQQVAGKVAAGAGASGLAVAGFVKNGGAKKVAEQIAKRLK